MSFYLAIISPLDSPLYELSLSSASSNRTSLAGQSSASGQNSSTLTASSSTAGFPSWSSFTGSGGAEGYGVSTPSTPSAGAVAGPGGGGQGGQSGPNGQGPAGGGDRALFQMIAFKALDGVEEVMESTGSLYLRNVDKYNEWMVSAYLAMGVKFVLVHDQKNDDGIRMFFNDLWELWVKILLNPFHTVNTPIRSSAFESRVRAAARRYL